MHKLRKSSNFSKKEDNLELEPYFSSCRLRLPFYVNAVLNNPCISLQDNMPTEQCALLGNVVEAPWKG